jgi:hypothetical protein
MQSRRAARDAVRLSAERPEQLSAALLDEVAARLSGQRLVPAPEPSWEATGGVRKDVTTGAMVIAGFLSETADRTRLRTGIAVNRF